MCDSALHLTFSLLTEADAGHTEFMDEVYQNEARFPGGEWKPASEPYTDVVRIQNMDPNSPSICFSEDNVNSCVKLR